MVMTSGVGSLPKERDPDRMYLRLGGRNASPSQGDWQSSLTPKEGCTPCGTMVCEGVDHKNTATCRHRAPNKCTAAKRSRTERDFGAGLGHPAECRTSSQLRGRLNSVGQVNFEERQPTRKLQNPGTSSTRRAQARPGSSSGIEPLVSSAAKSTGCKGGLVGNASLGEACLRRGCPVQSKNVPARVEATEGTIPSSGNEQVALTQWNST